MVVTDGDDDDLSARLLVAQGDEETRASRGEEEQDRNMSTINTTMSKKTLSGKRKLDHHASSSSSSCLSKEPIRAEPIQEVKLNRHDASSSSVSSNEPISAEPIREVKLNRHDASSSSVSSKEPIRAEPIGEVKPVRGINQVRQPIRRESEVSTPRWVVDLMREKKGVDGKLIMEKEITASDLSRNLSRLLMPFKQMKDTNFLNEEELNIVERHYKRACKQGVDVILVSSRDGKPWKLNLRKWDMKTTTNYVLCTGWHHVCLSYDIKKGDTIRIWSFHSEDEKLYFALVLDTVPDPAQAMAYQDLAPAQAMARQDLAPALAIASSSSMAPVVSRYSDDVFICDETNKRLCNFPKRKRTLRVCVPAPSTMAPLEAVQETDTRTSLVLFTATSQVSDTETTALDQDRVEDKES